MPNMKQVEIVGQAAEIALERVSPQTAAKLAACLPEIFGSSAQATEAFAKAPAEASILEKLGLSYQSKLETFGLPPNATPKELVERMQAHRLGFQTESGGGRGYRWLNATTDFADGSSLFRSQGAGRSLAFDKTFYRSADRTASIQFDAINRSNGYRPVWHFKTASLEGKVEVPFEDVDGEARKVMVWKPQH